MQVLTTEAVQGAKKFLAGLGRGGKFNVNQGKDGRTWNKCVPAKSFEAVFQILIRFYGSGS